MSIKSIDKTMFTEWMYANVIYPEGRHLTYNEYPIMFVWKENEKKWSLRKSGCCICRLYYAHPSSGERFYLRTLLNIVKGAKSYEDIRTVNGVQYPTFKEACCALGLLDDDKEWIDSVVEAAN